MKSGEPSAAAPERGTRFATTRWSLIRRIDDSDGGGAREVALAEMCRIYWFPLYAFVRRNGKSREDAEDLTQSFFAHLLSKEPFGDLSSDKGLFRTFLLKSLKHFLIDDVRREQSAKRGGDVKVLSIDVDDFENRIAAESENSDDLDLYFDRAWAVALVDQVYAKLGADYKKAGKGELFVLLKTCLLGKGDRSYVDMANAVGMSEGGFTMAVQRIRKRFGEEIRAEVEKVVSDPSEVDDELRWLLTVLGGTAG